MPDRDYLQDARRAADNGSEPNYAIAYALIDIASRLRTITAALLDDNYDDDTQCTSDVTLGDEEHSLVRCGRPAGHPGSHSDGHSTSWTGGQQ